MPSKRRTKLDQEISRVQKNTRNKLYRIRVKGATNVDEFDPRLPVSEILKMTGSQKTAYLRRLRQFNQRSNSFYVQPQNGVALPMGDYARYKAAEQRANDARLALRKAIEDVASEYDLMDISDDPDFAAWTTTRFDTPYDIYIPQTNKFHDLVPVHMKAGFPSVSSLKRETERAEKSLTIIERHRKQYRSWKKGIRNKMNENGFGALGKRISNLTNAQIDWLHYYTDFDQLVSNFRYVSELDEGYTDLVDDYTIEQLEDILDAANRIPRTAKRAEVNIPKAKKPAKRKRR